MGRGLRGNLGSPFLFEEVATGEPRFPRPIKGGGGYGGTWVPPGIYCL